MLETRPEISLEIHEAALEEIRGLKVENQYLKLELERIKKALYGVKSERFVAPDPAQLTLFPDLGAGETPAPTQETVSYTRTKPSTAKKNGHARLEIPAHLPRVQVTIKPDPLPEGATCIGQKVSSVLEYTPGKVYVREIIRPKYLVKNGDEKRIIIADLPSLPIPHGNAGASFLSHIAVSKVIDHLPFYRQTKIFQRQQDFAIAESVLVDNFRQACTLLEPLFDVLRQTVRSSPYLMVDETPLPVLSADKPGSTHQGYFWVFYSPPLKLACFVYHHSRGQQAPGLFLEGFQGSIQTDGYQVYDKYENKKGIILLGCMAHARRKFFEARSNDRARSDQALGYIQRLYKVEDTARDHNYTPQQRQALRVEQSVPILDEFRDWLKAQVNGVLPRSPIGKAVLYTLGMWPRLERYTTNGMYEIDNNLVENSIRPVALGRKNYLFAGSHDAAGRLATMYSLLISCKMQGKNPHAWLTDVLNQIQDTKTSQLETLLPHLWQPQPE